MTKTLNSMNCSTDTSGEIVVDVAMLNENYFIFRVAMSIVDDYEEPPELKKDIFWNLSHPELIEHPEIIDIQDTEKIEVEVKQECNNVYHHHIINGGCKDTLL